MAQRLQLRVFRTVLDAIETLIREAWPLFKIYAPPWLAGTAAVLVFDLMWAEQHGSEYPPQVLSALIFAPFSALIAAGAIRWLWQRREDFRLYRFDKAWVWVTAAYALLALIGLGLENLRMPWSMYVSNSAGLTYMDWETTHAYLMFFVLSILPAWLLTAAVYLALLPQVAVIVERGAPSLERQWQLMRLAPLALIGLALITGMSRLGFGYLWVQALTALGVGSGPLDGALFGWRAEVMATLWWSLLALPSHFLTDMLVLVVLARTYNALAGIMDRKVAASE